MSDAEAEADPAADPADDLFDRLEELEQTVDTHEERRQVRAAMRAAVNASHGPAVFGRVVRGFDRGDLAEALLGSLLFGIPMFVEGGTQEVGSFIAARPALLLGTVVLAIGVVVSILYVADIQDVRVQNPILGVVPRRLVGVLGVSFLTAVVMMTAWGRVDWSAPTLALADVVVAFVPMSIGAALGDILPAT